MRRLISIKKPLLHLLSLLLDLSLLLVFLRLVDVVGSLFVCGTVLLKVTFLKALIRLLNALAGTRWTLEKCFRCSHSFSSGGTLVFISIFDEALSEDFLTLLMACLIARLMYRWLSNFLLCRDNMCIFQLLLSLRDTFLPRCHFLACWSLWKCSDLGFLQALDLLSWLLQERFDEVAVHLLNTF